MGRSVSRAVGGGFLGGILGFLADPLQIEESNYQKKQMEKAVREAEAAQLEEQRKLIARQEQLQQDALMQESLTKQRAVEESAYGISFSDGYSTILTSAAGLLDGAKVKKSGKKTILGSFDASL